MRFHALLTPFLLGSLLALSGACSSEADDEDTNEEWATAKSPTLVLRGTLVTMDEARGNNEVIEGGALVIKGDKIVDVLEPGAPLPADKKTIVLPSREGPSDWVITPGLINMHNHLAYNTSRVIKDLPLYQNTYQWRDEKYYDTEIQYPKKYLGECSAPPEEVGSKKTDPDRVDYQGLVGRYAEVKELVSGTTTTQGSFFGTQVSTGYGSTLVRNLDWTNFGARRVSQTALGILVPLFDPREVVARMDAGEIDAWLVHLLEGTDQESRDEFDCLKAMGLVRKETVIIHGTALTKAQMAEMAKVGAKLVTSPLDNLLYYGATPDLVAAKEVGLKVSLGTDWSPAGSKNMLAELKVFDLLNKQAYKGAFDDRDMIRMVTVNPADSIGWSDKVGRLKKGLFADVAVYDKKPGSAYRAIIDATERDVHLVVVGGDPLYGDAPVMQQLKPGDTELVQACGFEKALDITTTKASHGDLRFSQVKAALSKALSVEPDFVRSHYEPAIEGKWSPATFASNMRQKFPKGLAARDLDPVFMCEDQSLLEEIRTDANIRTAFAGLCLDLRPWYSGAKKADCGAKPPKPQLLTVDKHPGTVPMRPAAWCAKQNWTGTGELPKPPKKGADVIKPPGL
jgi:cytosine/adenosine deaminase-related metal-dependent hydrolase